MGASQPLAALRQRNPDVVKRAVAFIVKNFAGPVRLADLARSAGVSAEDLTTGFGELYGVSPMTWLWMFRTILAAEILTHAPQFPLDEVAEATGFDDPVYFASCFIKILGEEPSDFRAHAVILRQAEARLKRHVVRFEQVEAARGALVGNALEKILTSLKPEGR